MTLPVSINVLNSKDKTWSFREVLDTFEAIEKELQPDESLIAGVPWWDALRYPLFSKILQELSLHEKTKIKRQKHSLLNRLNKGLKLCFTALKLFFSGSPLLVSRNSVVMWGHPRRKL